MPFELDFWCPRCGAAFLLTSAVPGPRHPAQGQLEFKTTASMTTATLERLTFGLEIKAVDVSQRIIEGYAAVTGNLDRVGDIIDAGAFSKTLKDKKAADIGVFLGHDMGSLPLGVPLEVREDGKGLFTRTRIFRTTAGDDLLQTAFELQTVGKTLGMSIGYLVRDFSYAQTPGQAAARATVRHLKEVELIEYSYAAAQSIANPQALVTAVKQQPPTEPEAESSELALTKVRDGAAANEADAVANEGDATASITTTTTIIDDDGDAELKVGRRMRREYRTLLAELEAGLAKLRSWVDYDDALDDDAKTDDPDQKTQTPTATQTDMKVDAYADLPPLHTTNEDPERARELAELDRMLASLELRGRR